MNAAKKYGNRPGFLSVSEAALALGIDRSVVCRAIRHGVIPLATRHGRRVVPAAAVARLLRHTDDPVPDADPRPDDGHDASRPGSGGAS
jgi:Helix-turn-helix domain